MTKANKGEWSEFYAFLKILVEKKIFSADKNLEIIPDKFIIFRKIFRDEKDVGIKIFNIIEENEILITNANDTILKKYPTSDIKKHIKDIFKNIKDAEGSSFEIIEAEKLKNDLLCTRIKAGNMQKADIEAEIYDRFSEMITPLGFSIKSMIGGASTLLNAGKTTNFIFQIDGISDEKAKEINKINTKSKVQDRVSEIILNGGSFSFIKPIRDEFTANMRKIDTVFSEILSQMLLDFFKGKGRTIVELTNLLSKNTMMKNKYRLNLSDYEYKVKNFLLSSALGMIPSKIWNGFTKVHGGYIVVRNDGEIICYHKYNEDEFLSYLYENTKFESASSSRHDYGSIYTKDGKTLFNLNLQIRFIK